MNDHPISPENLERLKKRAESHHISLDALINQLLDKQMMRYTHILDVLPDAVVLYSTENRILYVNRAGGSLLGLRGLSISDAIGKNTQELGYPDAVVSAGQAAFERVMHTKSPDLMILTTPLDVGGTVLESMLTPILTPTGEVECLLCVIHNITNRAQIAKALHQSEAYYRLLFKEAPIGITKQDFSEIKAYLEELQQAGVHNIEAYLRANPQEVLSCLRLVRVIEANNTALEMYRVKTIEAIRTTFLEILEVDDPQQPASLAAIMSGKTQFSGEFLNRDKAGNPIYVLIKWLVIPGHEATYDEVLVVIIDITEQKRYQDYLVEQENLITRFRKEQEHNILVQRSVHSLSHDLRTPLSVIATSKDLLLRHFDKLTHEKRKQKLESIGKQLEFALELLDDTISMVRGALSERAFKPSIVHLDQLCRVSAEEVGMSYGVRDQIQFENVAGITTAYVDEILLSRILLNLLTNAIKYSPNQTPITLQLDHQADDIILRVIDRGIGISPEYLPHIFEPFYRAPDVKEIGGAGLGLSIVKDCVTRHNGQISIISELGIGTTVTVRLFVKK